jgi:hypothetical protein
VKLSQPDSAFSRSASGRRSKRCGPFVDKAGSGGHNEKASSELQSRFTGGFTHSIRARMAELADAQVSEACDLTVVEVRVLFRAPKNIFRGALARLLQAPKCKFLRCSDLFLQTSRPVKK